MTDRLMTDPDRPAGRVMNALHGRHLPTRFLGGFLVNACRAALAAAHRSLPSSARSSPGPPGGRPPLTLASGGSEPVVTGSVLLAFGIGWGLMAS